MTDPDPLALDQWRKEAEICVATTWIVDAADQASRVLALLDLVAKARMLRASAEEVERVLAFAFEEGALTDEQVSQLCIDPYGVLADLRTSLAATASLKESERG